MDPTLPWFLPRVTVCGARECPGTPHSGPKKRSRGWGLHHANVFALDMNGALRILISLTCHSSPWLIHSFPFMRPLRQGSRLAQSRATVLRAGVNLMWLPHLIACEQRGLTMETLTHSAFCLSQDGQRSLGKRQGGDGDKDHINQHKGGRSVCAGAYSRW